MDFSQRSYEKELMDLGGFSEQDFLQNLQELKYTNQLLGGHKATLHAFRQLTRDWPKTQTLHIADVGCGGGDTLRFMATYCQKKGIKARFTGIDLNPVCIALSKQNMAGFDCDFIHAPYQEVQQNFDLILCALFTHHLNEQELDHYLLWASQHARLGIIINDLHRHRFAWASIWLLSRVLGLSYLYKNDAPLSVRRGFLRQEWLAKASKLNIKLHVKWIWAFRHAIWHPTNTAS